MKNILKISKKNKSRRLKAISWWNSLNTTDKLLLLHSSTSKIFGRDRKSLTGREIENLWKQQ